MDVATLAAIEDFCKTERWWKKSAVINNLLGNLVISSKKADFRKLATHWPKSNQKLEISVNDSSM